MSFRRLQWLAILAPIVLVGVLEYTRFALAPVLDTWQGHLLIDAIVVVIGVVFFYGAVFTVFDHVHARLRSRNLELAALRSASLEIGGELDLERVLGKVVDQARNLIQTEYGALSVIDENDEITTFVTSGIERRIADRIGEPPRGRGLLGVVLREGQRLRIDEIQQDVRSVGFPDGHPSMSSLLAVPVVCRGPFRGNLYLAEKVDGAIFSEAEEETLARFATQAAIAIDNAYIHERVGALAVAEERVRLAREMHDGQAQVLASVNAKAQAVRELLRRGDTSSAATQLDELAASARSVYADVREGILSLRAVIDEDRPLEDVLAQFVRQWQDQNGIRVTLTIDRVPRLGVEVELQVLRIVQEVLANVRKHAQAEKVDVVLGTRKDGSLLVRVEDDGVGFDRGTVPTNDGGRMRSPRFGLATMHERAEAIGAELVIETARGEGTRVMLVCPDNRRLTAIDESEDRRGVGPHLTLRRPLVRQEETRHARRDR